MEILKHEHHAQLRQEIADLEHQWIDATLGGDAATLHALLADHVIVVTSDGAAGRGRHAATEAVLGTCAGLQGIDVTRTEVHLLGAQTALVTGQALLGAPLGTLTRFTRVWQQFDDKWKVVATHSSLSQH